jgi:hypothetical protein
MRKANEGLEPPIPWGPEKKLHWFTNQNTKRSYADDVLSRVNRFSKRGGSLFTVTEYGRLTVCPEKYPLYAFQLGDPKNGKPNVLLTGGVHGYETSGVKGALQFLEEHVLLYLDCFNFVVAPCVSPWSYETINRLNPLMENPNREFKGESKSEESRFLMDYLKGLAVEFDGHIDLHETTDSDRVFLPEEYAKNGLPLTAEDVGIPDGYYLIGAKGHENPALERAIIDRVRKGTHIAEADAGGRILDLPLSQEGVIHSLIPGLCGQYTAAVSRLGAYTTEMYPDSPRFQGLGPPAVEAVCNNAQVASILGALDFWKR